MNVRVNNSEHIQRLIYSITKQFFPFYICWSQLIWTGLIWTELNCIKDSNNNYSTCDISHFYVMNTHTNTHWNEVSYSNTTLSNLERSLPFHPLTLRLSRPAKTMISCHSRSSSHAKRGANAPLDTDKSETVMSSNVLFHLAMSASQKLKDAGFTIFKLMEASAWST